MRALPLLLAAVLMVAACSEPSPPMPTGPAATGSPSSTTSASAIPEPTPAARIDATHQIGATSIAVANDAVWYLRIEPSGGIVGRLDVTTGQILERPAGPAPVAIAASDGVVVILEGMPDPPSDSPRTNVVERLDAATLEPVAEAALPALPTSVAIAGSTILVAGIRGTLGAYATDGLAERWTATVPGRGPTAVAADAASAWVLVGDVEGGRYLLRSVDVATGGIGEPVEIEGSGSDGLLAVSGDPWVGAVNADGARSSLVEVIDRVPSAPLSVPRLSAIAAAPDNVVWWLTSAGAVNRASGGLRSAPVTIGSEGIALARGPGDGSVWASTATDLVHLVEP